MARFFLPVTILLLGILIFSSCNSSKNITYFNNVKDTTFYSSTTEKQIPLQANDIISVTISSANAEASIPFNLLTNNVSRSTTTVTGGNNQQGGYLINSDGTIDLPILGSVKAAGFTKVQLKDNITNLILLKKLLINPIVDIRYLNYEVTVLGEVAKPTVITVPNEKISLLKAIGLAGDLTIYGKRENVLLIRQGNGEKITRHINLNSSDFFNSPYYYLQPNDIVYVEPNKQKAAIARRNPNILPIALGAMSLISIFILYKR